MMSRFGVRRGGVFGLAALAMFFAAGGARAQDCTTCNKSCCPPPYRHCQEGAPRIKVEKGCPLPICNPCNAPNWGYYQTCWNPWPWGRDFSHCPVMPPAAHVHLSVTNQGTPPLPTLPQTGTPVQRLPVNDNYAPAPRPLPRPGQ